jgi:decaprenylphospho-beta-D-erythro-pentofuranosid-2-ulose 2-reductase
MTTISSALQPRQTAVVVGASSGIGAALARRLARDGYTLALLARRAEALEEVCKQINAESGAERARAYPHDVTQTGEAPALFQTILRDLGGLMLVVYCAGRQLPVALGEYDFAKDQAMLDANLLGAVAWLNQAALLFERTGRGQIVGISSIAGERGRVGAPVYNTSKAALNTYLEALRNRLTRHGVNVLTVRPGFVQTELLKNSPRTFWVISPEQAADDIWQAIRARKQVVFTPARWRLVALGLRHVPSVLFRRMSF